MLHGAGIFIYFCLHEQFYKYLKMHYMLVSYESPNLEYRSLLSWGLLCNSVYNDNDALDDVVLGGEEGADDWLN